MLPSGDKTMKKIAYILLLMLFLPCLCQAQDIFIDYYVETDIDQCIFWVMTDANNVKYRGGCDIALGIDPNAYCEAHKAEWLAAIYAMNTDPNVPDWVDSHPGKYLAAMALIDTVDSFAKVRAVMKKMVKTIYPMRLNIED